MGDIAIPDPRRDADWHKDIQDGLQVEEEGLRPPQEPTLPPEVQVDNEGADFGDALTPAAVHNGELVRPTPKDPAAVRCSSSTVHTKNTSLHTKAHFNKILSSELMSDF